MPRDAVSWTANVERNSGHKWVNFVSIQIYVAIIMDKIRFLRHDFEIFEYIKLNLISLEHQIDTLDSSRMY